MQGGGGHPESQSSDVLRMQGMAEVVFNIVLPTVEERGGGVRHLTRTDEMAFAEATFPHSTELVRNRWVWEQAKMRDTPAMCCEQRGYDRCCLAAGALRVLMQELRDNRITATARETRLRLLPKLALDTLLRGSSRALGVVQADLVWGRGVPAIVTDATTPLKPIDIFASYVASTHEPEDVVGSIARSVARRSVTDAECAARLARTAGSGDRLTEVLATSGHVDSAVQLLCLEWRDDAPGQAAEASRLIEALFKAACPMSWVRRVIDGFRQRAARPDVVSCSAERRPPSCTLASPSCAAFDAAFDARWNYWLPAAITAMTSPDSPYTADDLEYLTTIFERGTQQTALASGDDPATAVGEWLSSRWQDLRKYHFPRMQEHLCVDARKLSWIEGHMGEFTDPMIERAFRNALRHGAVDTLEYLRSRWARLPAATRERALLEGIGFGGGGVLPAPALLLAAVPIAGIEFRPRLPQGAPDSPPRMPAVRWLLHADDCIAGVALDRVFGPARRWIPRCLTEAQLPAVLDELESRGALSRGDVVEEIRKVAMDWHTVLWTMETLLWAAGMLQCDPAALFQTNSSLPLSREAARRHPEWFNCEQVRRLLTCGELEAVDNIAERRPELVDQAEVEAMFGDLAGRLDWFRVGPWIARRGHPIADIGEAATYERLLRVATNARGEAGIPEGLALAARLLRPGQLDKARRACWRALLAAISVRGYAAQALALAKVLGIQPFYRDN
jgi:hypothetical protein